MPTGTIAAGAQAASDAPASHDEAPRPGVAAVDRALSILTAIEAEPEPPTLSELSRATNLYKSTILRLLETLQAHGYVTRIHETRYALGPAVYRLGVAYEQRNPLKDHILPELARLVEAGTESPSFHVRQNAESRVCLFRLDSNHATLDRVHVGDLLPLDRGAAGKVILAWDGEDARWKEIRGKGWALSLGERDPSCAGLAAPVFGPHRRLIGALSVSGPRDRFTEANIAAMRRETLESARRISAALGG